METPRHGRLRERTAGEVRSRLARERISAAEFARLVGWSQPYMARRYDGRVAMDVDDLEVIADALGIKVADLFAGSGSQTTEAKVGPTVRPMPHPVSPQSQPHGRPRPEVTNDPQPNPRPAHTVNPARRRPVRLGQRVAAQLPPSRH